MDKDRIIEKLTRQVALLLERVRQVEQENTMLKQRIAQLERNSSNSSKPPSSDIIKPVKILRQCAKKHNRGGQRSQGAVFGPGVTVRPCCRIQIDHAALCRTDVFAGILRERTAGARKTGSGRCDTDCVEDLSSVHKDISFRVLDCSFPSLGIQA